MSTGKFVLICFDSASRQLQRDLSVILLIKTTRFFTLTIMLGTELQIPKNIALYV